MKVSKQVKGRVRAGEGAWARWGGNDGDTVVAFQRSYDRPNEEGWAPLYPASRVMGDSYRPYLTCTPWAEAANAAMSAEANANFRRRSL